MRKAKGQSQKAEAKEEQPVEAVETQTGDDGKPSKRSTEQLLQSIRDQVRSLYEKLDPVQARFRFRQRPSTAEINAKPLVVFLGNHSSGKSTFINYVLKRANPDLKDTQKTGVAPLDDGFTFIMHGDNQDEQQGPAIVANTNLPFASLGKFGDQFVQHLRLKMIPVQLLQNVILVDSPGMIDSATEGADRGYDFIKAVRWFAERADYVLVFFDPDKPGTTGESLEVFTKALHGIEHKLLILMNKVDKFQRIDDFSRAYGALCWNLAKIIKTKDLPYIWTTFVPQRDESSQRSWSLEEFAKSRDEIISKIHHAPSRHMDNMLTETKKYTEQLLMHAKVITAARNQLWWLRLQLWLVALVLIGAAIGITWKLTKDELFTSLPLIALLPAFFIITWALSSRERSITRDLRRVFEKTHEIELMSRDAREEHERQWSTVEQHTVSTIERFGLLSFPTLSKRDAQMLDQIYKKDITALLTQVHKMLVKQRGE